MAGEVVAEGRSVLNYPLELGFKVATVGTRVRVTDATGRQIGYVRKKKFKLREDVSVYENEDQHDLRFRIKADRTWDFGASYAISGPDGRQLGAVRRQGMRSLWKSSYSVVNPRGEEVALIHEENPWTKVLDSLVESLPFADALDGLFFNPAYLVDLGGRSVLRLQKRRSLFESRFKLEQLGDFSRDEEELLLASVIMMLLIERERG